MKLTVEIFKIDSNWQNINIKEGKIFSYLDLFQDEKLKNLSFSNFEEAAKFLEKHKDKGRFVILPIYTI